MLVKNLSIITIIVIAIVVSVLCRDDKNRNRSDYKSKVYNIKIILKRSFPE